MEEPPSKKTKLDNCIICNTSSEQTTKNVEEYTKFLISQMVPSNEKHKFDNSLKAFNFCINCLDVIDELVELKQTIDYLLNCIERRKCELRCKLVQIGENFEHEYVKMFRQIASRGLRPKVSMLKNNVLISEESKKKTVIQIDPEISPSKTKSSEISIKPSSQKHDKIPENGKINYSYPSPNIESGNTSYHNTNTHYKLIIPLNLFRKEKDGEVSINSKFANASLVNQLIAKKDDQVTSESAVLNKENDSVMTDSFQETILPHEEESTINNLETQIKSEAPEICDGDDEFQIHNWEEIESHPEREGFPTVPTISSTNAENYDDQNYLVENTFTPSAILPAQICTVASKKWPKPMLTSQQLCYLALLCPKPLFKSSQEIVEFLSENFPFYFEMKKYFVTQLKQTMGKSTHFDRYFDTAKGEYFFSVVRDANIVMEEKRPIYKYLCSNDILTTMAFPERIYQFQFALDPYGVIPVSFPPIPHTFVTDTQTQMVTNSSTRPFVIALETSKSIVTGKFDKSVNQTKDSDNTLPSFITATWPKPSSNSGKNNKSISQTKESSTPTSVVTKSTPKQKCYALKTSSRSTPGEFDKSVNQTQDSDILPSFITATWPNPKCYVPRFSKRSNSGKVVNDKSASQTTESSTPTSVITESWSKSKTKVANTLKSILPEEVANEKPVNQTPATLIIPSPPIDSTVNGHSQDINNDDDVQIISEASTECDTVVNPAIHSASVPEKVYSKPPITCQEICFCAIMTSGSMLVSVIDVYNFIRENFPLFYDPSLPQHLCLANIETTLDHQFKLITRFSEAIYNPVYIVTLSSDDIYPYLYTVRDNNSTFNLRKKTASSLSHKINLAAMAFPDRVYGFIQHVLTRNITPDAYFYLLQNQQIRPAEVPEDLTDHDVHNEQNTDHITDQNVAYPEISTYTQTRRKQTHERIIWSVVNE